MKRSPPVNNNNTLMGITSAQHLPVSWRRTAM